MTTTTTTSTTGRVLCWGCDSTPAGCASLLVLAGRCCCTRCDHGGRDPRISREDDEETREHKSASPSAAAGGSSVRPPEVDEGAVVGIPLAMTQRTREVTSSSHTELSDRPSPPPGGRHPSSDNASTRDSTSAYSPDFHMTAPSEGPTDD